LADWGGYLFLIIIIRGKIFFPFLNLHPFAYEKDFPIILITVIYSDRFVVLKLLKKAQTKLSILLKKDFARKPIHLNGKK